MTATSGIPGRDELHEAIAQLDAEYDSATGTVRSTVRGAEYHTRLKRGTAVRPTLAAADYALGLLDAGEQWRTDRAVELLWRLVETQDSDPASDTYGIWPWFYDEPLDQMATPDWNWADFVGVRLVQIVARHGDRLRTVDDRLRHVVEGALQHASRSIMRRDVKLSYTNIAIMGTYVTIMAGDLLNDTDILGYGRDRLRRFAEFTEGYGGFPEYNSPAYTTVAIVELTRMLRDLRRGEDRELVRCLHDRAWEEAAAHWHAPSGQWAGPHSRSYVTLAGADPRKGYNVVQRGLGKRAKVIPGTPPPSLNHWLVPLRCPDHLVTHFTDPVPNRDLVARVSNATAAVTALTRLRPEYALGVASYGTFWEQARPLIAYALGASGPQAWRLRLLYDGRDLAAGRLFTAVAGNIVLAGVCVANDIGANHPNLDYEWTGRIRTADLRLRLEFLGLDRRVSAAASLNETFKVAFGAGGVFAGRLLDGRFADEEPRVECGAGEVDLVLYSGPERIFAFTPDQAAYATLALSMSALPGSPDDLSAIESHLIGEEVELRIGSERRLAIPATPRPVAELEATASRLAGESLESHHS